MSKIVHSLILAATLVAAPAFARRDSPDVQLHKLLDGRVAGRPIDCLSLSSVRSSTIIDGQAIVYRAGSRLYVNVPRSGASTLDDDDILVTHTFGDRLCSRDAINLVDRSSRIPHGFVLLGEFVPYEKPKPGR